MTHFWCTLRIIHNPQRARDVPCQGCLPQTLQHQDNIKGPIVQDEEGKRMIDYINPYIRVQGSINLWPGARW